MHTRILNAVLSVSALALGLLVVLRSGGLTGSARAEMVSQAGEFTMMTTDSGTEEVLVVLDNRSEQLMVYRIKAQKTLELMQNVSVARMFESARLGAEGK